MDSMRNLHSSLPRATRRTATRQPPAELLAAFKSAALSVTQLYKSASADQEAARAAGYQDALDDLLEMLDAENLGLGDGEGWRVRQWATERLTTADEYGDDNEMDATEVEKENLSTQTSTQRASSGPASTAASGTELTAAATTRTTISTPTDHGLSPEVQQKFNSQSHTPSQLPPHAASSPSQQQQPTDRDLFTFRANQYMPSPQDFSNSNTSSPSTTTSSSFTDSPNIFSNFHLQVIPSSNSNSRTSRQHASSRSHGSHHNNSSHNATTHLGHGAGAKRKAANLADFFDLSTFGSRDGDHDGGNGGGGKKGRLN